MSLKPLVDNIRRSGALKNTSVGEANHGAFMRRVEVTANLSPRVWDALKVLLDVEPQLLRAAWSDCSLRGRGYYVTTIQHPTTQKLRALHIPSIPVREVQRRILTQVLYQLPISPAAYGGVPKRSYVHAARVHLSQPGELLQMDVRDAFRSTSYGELSRYLRRALKQQLWVLELSRQERKIIVGWLTHLMVVSPEGGRYPTLPLGTPTSVGAFNALWAPIDAEIERAALKLCGEGLRYTRYVDDLVFSHPNALSPDLEGAVMRVLSDHGYELNRQKTRGASRDEAVVHGLSWREGGLSLPEGAVLKTAQRAHRIQALLNGHPTERDWREAAQLLTELEMIGRQVYNGGPRPQGLTLSEELIAEIKRHSERPLPRWADELWG